MEFIKSLKLSLKQLLESNLSVEQMRYVTHVYSSLLYGNDLNRLAQVYRTDKWGRHFYTKHYQTHFASRRQQSLKILEIGIGGEKNPLDGGNSLRMWRTFFPNSMIYGLDIYDKSYHSEPRIKIFQGSQVDTNFLDEVLEEIGEPDIIIDDGSHINEHVISTFEYLFPKLKIGGIYAIEDTQTSYWPKYGGNPDDLISNNTSMGYFKSLTDSINYKEYKPVDYEPNYFERFIVSMHFYHNLIFIYKGENNEKGESYRITQSK